MLSRAGLKLIEASQSIRQAAVNPPNTSSRMGVDMVEHDTHCGESWQAFLRNVKSRSHQP
jgi:hypothetical protein